jgi:hypothetical protein
MALTLWTTTALVIWLVLWAIGAKPIDAFMVATLIIVVGVTLEIVKRYLPGRRR